MPLPAPVCNDLTGLPREIFLTVFESLNSESIFNLARADPLTFICPTLDILTLEVDSWKRVQNRRRGTCLLHWVAGLSDKIHKDNVVLIRRIIDLYLVNFPDPSDDVDSSLEMVMAHLRSLDPEVPLLHRAVTQGYTEQLTLHMVRMLIMLGEDPNETWDGLCALDIAVASAITGSIHVYTRLRVIMLLISLGADPRWVQSGTQNAGTVQALGTAEMGLQLLAKVRRNHTITANKATWPTVWNNNPGVTTVRDCLVTMVPPPIILLEGTRATITCCLIGFRTNTYPQFNW